MNAELLVLHINRQFVLTNNSQAGREEAVVRTLLVRSAETEAENKEKH